MRIPKNHRTEKPLFDGGYVTFEGATPKYHFYVQDHLGNNRAVVSQTGVVEQQTQYYPSGAIMTSISFGLSQQPYLYSGKELDRMHALDWYDFGARHYDAALLRWQSIDPMCEKYYHISPYAFCANNFVNAVDKDGRDGVRIIDEENQTIVIKANYYVQTGNGVGVDGVLAGYTASDIEFMNQTINDFLNNLNIKVDKGEYKDYSVQFDLTFLEGGNPYELANRAEADKLEGFPIGNTFEHKDDAYKRFIPNEETGTTVGGVTDKNKYIVMNVKYDNLMNRTHEVFHTLGLDDSYKSRGIMAYPPSTPIHKEIRELVYGTFLNTICKR